MITDQQNIDYFSGIGIDYLKLTETEKKFLKDTTMYKWYVLSCEWANLGRAIKESFSKVRIR